LALKINKIAFVVLKLAVSSLFLYMIFARTGSGKVLAALGSINISAFIVAISLYIFAQVISTLRWKLLLPKGLGIKKLFSLYMIGSFFNLFLPGIIGGDAVKGYYLYRVTGNGSLSMASVFMDRYLGFVVLIAICAAAFPFGYTYLQGSYMAWVLPFTIVSFIAGSLIFFGLRLGQRVKFLSEFYNHFNLYQNQKGVIGKALLLSVFVQFSVIIAVYILSIGLGLQVPFLAFLIYLPLITLFSMLPISISGLGVREGAFVVFFGLIGVQPEAATAVSLSWFLAMSAGNLVGLIEYIKYKKEHI
jgi:glycosyltransferase 2 family protein